MRGKILIIVAALLPLTTASAFAAAGSFLQLGAGARPLGMGGAFSGVADDATGLWWNPAGIAQLQRSQFVLSHTEMFEGRRECLVSVVYPRGPLGVFGLGLISYGVTGISRRDVSGQPQGEFSDLENLLSLAYARGVRLGSFNLMIGGSGKIFYNRLADHTATGYGLDIGLLIQLPRLSLGAVIQNLGAGIRWDTGHKEEIPVGIRAGAKLSFSPLPLDLAFDLERCQGPAYHLGVEYQPIGFLSLRAGLDEGDIAAGVSFRPSPSVRIDYGFSTDPVSEWGLHRICVLMNL